MADKVQVEIELGSDAMQTPEQAAELVQRAADRLAAGDTDGPLIDANGNTVEAAEERERLDERVREEEAQGDG